MDEENVEETIKLYCKLHKIGPETTQKLISKYINCADRSEKALNNLLKGPTLSSEKDSSSVNLVQHSPKKNEDGPYIEPLNLQNIESLGLPSPDRSQKKKRKYSDGIEIFKVETSTDEGTKIYGSGRMKERSKNPLLEESKIKEETDEDNLMVEEIESPEIRINAIKQNTPRF